MTQERRPLTGYSSTCLSMPIGHPRRARPLRPKPNRAHHYMSLPSRAQTLGPNRSHSCTAVHLALCMCSRSNAYVSRTPVAHKHRATNVCCTPCTPMPYCAPCAPLWILNSTSCPCRTPCMPLSCCTPLPSRLRASRRACAPPRLTTHTHPAKPS